MGPEFPMAADWPSKTYVAKEALLIVDLLGRCQDSLLPSEAEFAADVTEARLRELRAGRSAARCAFQHFGLEPAPILSASDGVPIWPSGLCGSLSHSHRHIAALLARSSHYESVGVDIDDGRPLGTAALAEVATTDELAVIDRAGLATHGVAAEGIAFSAKEAVFKCQFPLTQDSSLNYLDVCLEPGKFPGSLGIRSIDAERLILKNLARRIDIQVLSVLGVTIVYALIRR